MKADQMYLFKYNDVMASLQAINEGIHDMPAPEGEIPITWEHVGQMDRILSLLDEVEAFFAGGVPK